MEKTTLQDKHSPDETTMAALAHGSVLLSFLGPIGPLLVWISQRRRSTYATFHALQAMAYQMAFFWIGMAIGLLFALVWMCLMFPLILSISENPDSFTAAPLLFEGGFFLFLFGIWGVYIIGGIVGAVMCLLKKDFRYPWVGKRLETYLRFDPATGALDEAMEERFVAAMAHASAILLMWGLLSPLAVWITQKERSVYLRFQGLQATVYQLIATLGYFAFMALYFVSAIGMMLLLSVGISSRQSEATLIVALVFGAVILLIWLVLVLALPTYHLFAMIAGIQILKGKDYRYPLLGNFIARRMKLDEPKG